MISAVELTNRIRVLFADATGDAEMFGRMITRLTPDGFAVNGSPEFRFLAAEDVASHLCGLVENYARSEVYLKAIEAASANPERPLDSLDSFLLCQSIRTASKATETASHGDPVRAGFVACVRRGEAAATERLSRLSGSLRREPAKP